MRKQVKTIVATGLTCLVVSAGTAGLTAWWLNRTNERPLSFQEAFATNPAVRLTAFTGANAGQTDLTMAAETSVHAVVHIKAKQTSKVQTVQAAPDLFDFFFGDGRGRSQRVQTPERVGFGSGVIISADGYIVTNNHVVDGADEITVKLNDNREMDGRIVGTDPATDLALVKVEATDLPSLPVGDSDALKVGEWVLAVGNPFNLTSTVTAGIVSAKARSIGIYNGGVESFIQTDAAINQGNSGGALVNTRGELVGINSALASPTGAYSGYGFAIPTSIMTKVVADLKQYGTVQRALLGIKGGSLGGDGNMSDAPIDKEGHTLADKRRELGVRDGVWVSEVVEGGSAEAAGIREGDVIVGLNGREIHTMAELQEALAKCRPGDRVKVKLVRNKKETTLDVTLKNEQGTTAVVKQADMDLLGAAFRPLPDEKKRQLNLNYGLEVTGVAAGRMADAGIRKGFIILKAGGQTMRTTEDLEKALKAAAKQPEQALFITGVYPSGKRASYAIDLAQEE